MIKKEPLLSICIPTYNREKYLKRCIDSIISQKEFIDTDDVEIVVDDGPSTDSTESLVKNYIKKYGNKVKYYRNPVKIGMCPAFLEALNLGTGKYLWLMGSDDFMNQDALSSIILGIKNNPKVIYSRRKEVKFGDHINKGKEKTTIISFGGMCDFCEYLGDTHKGNFNDKDVLFTFISVLVINKNYYKESYSNLIVTMDEIELKKNYFNFTFVSLLNIGNNDVISVITSPITVFCEKDNHGWSYNSKIYDDLSLFIKKFSVKYNLSWKTKKFFYKMKFCWKIGTSKILSGILNTFKNTKFHHMICNMLKKM